MKKYIKEYISEIDKKINDNHKFSSDEIDDFLFKMKLFQKLVIERKNAPERF